MGPFTGRLISPEHVDLYKNNNLMWEVNSRLSLWVELPVGWSQTSCLIDELTRRFKFGGLKLFSAPRCLSFGFLCSISG